MVDNEQRRIEGDFDLTNAYDRYSLIIKYFKDNPKRAGQEDNAKYIIDVNRARWFGEQ